MRCTTLTLLSWLFILNYSNGQRTKLQLYPLGNFSLDSNTIWAEQALASHMTDKVQYVSLGEVSHGGHELTLLKSKLVQYLVEKKGFRNFLFEYPNSQLAVLNYYLRQSNRTSLDTVAMLTRDAFSGLVQDKEISKLFVWIKKFNLMHKDDLIDLKGFDISGEASAFANYFMHNFSSLLDTGLKKSIDLKWNLVSRDSITREILNWFHQNKALIEKKSSWYYPEFLYTVQNATNKIRHDSIQKINFYQASAFRDSIMADNIVELSKTGKSFIWTHNLHASTGSNIVSMGNYLKKQIGDKYYAIMTDFISSATVKIVQNDKIIERQIGAGKKTTGTFIYKKTKSSSGIVFYKNLIDVKTPICVSSIDRVGNYQQLERRGKTFDALIFLDNITPSKLW